MNHLQKYSQYTQYVWISLPYFCVFSHRNLVTAFGIMSIVILANAAFLSRVFPMKPHAFGSRNWVNLMRAPKKSALVAMGWVAIAFSIYIMLSSFWTPLKGEIDWSFKTVAGFLGAVGIWQYCIIAPHTHVQKLAKVLTLAIILSCVLLGFEGITGSYLRDITPPDNAPGKDKFSEARGTAICIMALPFMLLLYKSLTKHTALIWRASIIGFVVICLATAAVTLDVSSNVLALLAAGIAALLAYFAPKLMIRLVILGVALSFVIMILIAYLLPDTPTLASNQTIPVSWLQRFVVWKVSFHESTSSIQQFLFGGGVNYAYYLQTLDQKITFTAINYHTNSVPTHPHNIFIQIMLEFGLAGVFLCWAFLYFLSQQITRFFDKIQYRENAKFMMAMIAAFIAIFWVYAMAEISLWTPWRLTGLYFSIMIFCLWLNYDQLTSQKPKK